MFKDRFGGWFSPDKFTSGVVIFCGLAAFSCAAKDSSVSEPMAGTVRQDMNEVYESTRRIYAKLWDREQFLAKNSEQSIQSDLDRLSKGFHSVERDVPIEQFEPGFRVVLQAQQELLGDAASRFRDGKKDYVMWRLRGMTGNCVACHSRVGVPVDFAGADPGSGRGTAEQVLGRGEFLTATRQFEKARGHLLGVVRGTDGINYDSETKLEALKLYLVSSVRVKSDFSQAAADLEGLISKGQIDPLHVDLVKGWSVQLRELGKYETMKPLAASRFLLKPVMKSSSEDEDVSYLVRTLNATRLLHAHLLTPLSQVEHRQAQFLLAAAYYHLPIRQFDVLRGMLLEQAIRENPRTAEARSAFEMYKALTELNATGSIGLNLEKEDIERINELRRIAFGPGQLVIPDTGLDLNQ